MEITIQNFRSYEHLQTFTFPASSLCLIKASSGKGKSSILDAIYFALYGFGRNIITFGSKSCKVKVTHNDLTISRSKGPNRLILQTSDCEYEGDVAQEIIKQKYGSHFPITSYITQQGSNSFFYLGPTDRINFLEKLALGDLDIEGMKERCKLKIKQRKEKLDKQSGMIAILSEEFSRLKIPEEMKCPFRCKTGDPSVKFVLKKISAEMENGKNISNKIEDTRSVICKLCKEREEWNLSKQIALSLSKQYEDVNAVLLSHISEMKNIPHICDEDIQEVQDRLNSLLLQKELYLLEQQCSKDLSQVESMSKNELEEYKKELQSLQSYSSIEDKSKYYQQHIQNKNKYQTLLSQKENIINQISKLLSEDIYINIIKQTEQEESALQKDKLRLQELRFIRECPNCHCSLRLCDEKLCLVSENISSSDIQGKNELELEKNIQLQRKKRREASESQIRLQQLQQSLGNIESQINQISSQISLDIDYDTEYKNHITNLQHQKERQRKILSLQNNLTNQVFSQSLSRLKAELQTKITKRNALREKIKVDLQRNDIDMEISKLTDQISSLKVEGQKYKLFSRQVKTAQENLNKKKSQIDHFFANIQITRPSEYLDECITFLKSTGYNFSQWDDKFSRIISELENNIKLSEERILSLTEESKKHKQTINTLNQYITYKKELENYKNHQERLNKAQEDEKCISQSLSIAENLLQIIRKSESEAVSHIIQTINNHISYYLERFFEEPIQVILSSFKELNSGEMKPTVDIKVGYRGHEGDITTLSGGERSRIEIALCLAFNEIIGNKLLLFDEILGPLDADTSESILDLLKEEASTREKIVIVVAHQATEGLFDHVISL